MSLSRGTSDNNRLTFRQYVTYVIKCLVGISIVFPALILLPAWRIDISWTIVSLMLAITYDNNSRTGIERMKGNIAGSFTGLTCQLLSRAVSHTGLLQLPHYWNLYISSIVGIAIVITICLKTGNIAASRTALVAFFIVMMYDDTYSTWQGAIARMVAVVTGCLLGLTINHLSSLIENRAHRISKRK